eukprot:766965-Hanusia_phi.AAC.4
MPVLGIAFKQRPPLHCPVVLAHRLPVSHPHPEASRKLLDVFSEKGNLTLIAVHPASHPHAQIRRHARKVSKTLARHVLLRHVASSHAVLLPCSHRPKLLGSISFSCINVLVHHRKLLHLTGELVLALAAVHRAHPKSSDHLKPTKLVRASLPSSLSLPPSPFLPLPPSLPPIPPFPSPA